MLVDLTKEELKALAEVSLNESNIELEEVKQALFNLDIRMDGKVVAETVRTSDSFRRK